MMERLIIVVQARVASVRFPGKVLAPLCGQSMLLWQLERLSHVSVPHILVVACPDTPGNEAIATLCNRHGYAVELVPVPENDLLARFQWVAQKYAATEVVRVTGDCPFLDPGLVEALIRYHAEHTERPDYTGMASEWGDGQDLDLLPRNVLEQAHAEAAVPSDREHVWPWIVKQGVRFRCVTMPCPLDLRAVQYSVDTQADFDVAERLLKDVLTVRGMDFGWRDVWLSLVRHPALYQRMQARGARNSAYLAQVARETGQPHTWDQVRYGLDT